MSEIRRTAATNRGVPLGVQRFFTETGIREADWHGKLWARWGDALKEAGFQPNKFNSPLDRKDLLNNLARLVRELGRFPVKGEMQMKARSEPGFPSHNTFRRIGGKQVLAAELEKHCRNRGENDIADLCAVAAQADDAEDAGVTEDTAAGKRGYVYLIKGGHYYKIGKTNALGRRERELAIQLPEPTKLVHSITTDDPEGIESYWHRRFKDRRKNGEWFELTPQDVAAFKRRSFM